MSALTLSRCRTPSVGEVLLEIPSSYLVFRESTMSETDFLRELARHTGCGLLLDINDVFVSATNLGRSALDYLSDFPIEHVGEIHLAVRWTERRRGRPPAHRRS